MKKSIAVANIKTSLIEKNEDDAFLAFAKKHYFNPSCSSYNEFLEDLKRIKYVKRLLFRFHKTRTLKSIKERLILNHLIVLKNVFGESPTAQLLYMRHEPKFHSYLKSFLVHMKFQDKCLNDIGFGSLHTDPRIDRKLSQLEEK